MMAGGHYTTKPPRLGGLCWQAGVVKIGKNAAPVSEHGRDRGVACLDHDPQRRCNCRLFLCCHHHHGLLRLLRLPAIAGQMAECLQLKRWRSSSVVCRCFAGGLLLVAAVLVASIDCRPAFGRVVLRSPLDVLSASFWPLFLPADVCFYISSYSLQRCRADAHSLTGLPNVDWLFDGDHCGPSGSTGHIRCGPQSQNSKVYEKGRDRPLERHLRGNASPTGAT